MMASALAKEASVRGIADDLRRRVESYRKTMSEPSYLFDKAEAVSLYVQWLAEAVEHATKHGVEEMYENSVGGAMLIAKDAMNFVVARLGPSLFMQRILVMRTPARYDAIRSALCEHINRLRTSAAKRRLRAKWQDKPGTVDQATDCLMEIISDIGVTLWRRSRVLIVGQGQVGKSCLSARLQGGGKQIEFNPTRGFYTNQVDCVETNRWKKLDEDSLVAEGVSMVAMQAAVALEGLDKVSQPRTLPPDMPNRHLPAVAEWGHLKLPPLVDDLYRIVAEVAERNEPPLRLSVWDFGGQLVFHAVHHLFFTRMGCYVLTFSCVEWLHANHARRRRAIDALRHWVRVVSACAKDAPIFFVGTFASSVKNREDLINISTSLKPIVQLATNVMPCNREGCPLLFWPVDNTHDEDNVFGDLRSEIEVSIEEDFEANGVKDEVPHIWMEALAEALVRRNTLKFIPRSALALLFQNLHARIGTRFRKATMLAGWKRIGADVYDDDDAREASLFLKRAHDLGVVAHFGESKRDLATLIRKSEVFLDPEWLINMITRIVRNFLIHHREEDELIWTADREAWAALQNGVLDAQKILPLLWRDVDFATSDAECVQQYRQTLLDFMCEVRLLAPRRDSVKVFWVPSILPFGTVSDNDLSFTSIRICHAFKFDFLPGGFFSKLLAGLLQQEKCLVANDCIRRSEAVLTIFDEKVFICEDLDHDQVALVLLLDQAAYQDSRAFKMVKREITLLVEALYDDLLKFRSTMMVLKSCPRAKPPSSDPFRTEYIACGYGYEASVAPREPSPAPDSSVDRERAKSVELSEQLDQIFKAGPLHDEDQNPDLESFFSMTSELRFRQLVDWIDGTADACLPSHGTERKSQLQKTAKWIVDCLQRHERTPSLAELVRICHANGNIDVRQVRDALVPESRSDLVDIMNAVTAAAATMPSNNLSDIEPESPIIAYYCIFDGDNELHKVTCERQAFVRQLCKRKLSIPTVDSRFEIAPVLARGFLSLGGTGARDFDVSKMASCKLLHVVAENSSGTENDTLQRQNKILSQPLELVDIYQPGLCLILHFCGSYAAALRIKEKMNLRSEQFSIICWQGTLDATAAKTFDEGFYKTYSNYLLGAKPQELAADAFPWIEDAVRREGDATRDELKEFVTASPISASFISALDYMRQRQLPQTHYPVLLHGRDAYYLHIYHVNGWEKCALSRNVERRPPSKDDATALANDSDTDYDVIDPPEDWPGNSLMLYRMEHYAKIIETLHGKASHHGLAILLETGQKNSSGSRHFREKLFSDYVKKPLEQMVACIAVICDYQVVEVGTVNRALSIANETADALKDIIYRFEDEDFLQEIQHGVGERCKEIASAYERLLNCMIENDSRDEDAGVAGNGAGGPPVKLAWLVRLRVAARRSIRRFVLFGPLEVPLWELETAQNTLNEWKATQEAKVFNDQLWKIAVRNKTFINLALVIAADRKHLDAFTARQKVLEDDAEQKAAEEATTHVWLPPESGMALTLNLQQFSPKNRVGWWSRFALWRRKIEVQDRIYWSIICFDDNALPRSQLPPRELRVGGAIIIDKGIVDATKEIRRNCWQVNTNTRQ